MDENDIRDWYYTGRMPIAFDMEEFNEMVNRIKAEAWKDGRESLALDMVKPMGEDGMKPSTKNPYEN